MNEIDKILVGTLIGYTIVPIVLVAILIFILIIW